MRPLPTLALALSLAALPAAASAGVAVPAALLHGSRAARRIALTFDACTTRDPTPYDPRVRAVLDALHVPATIFVGGGWALEEEAQLRALARDPLVELGNHTFSHPHLTRLSDAAIRAEL